METPHSCVSLVCRMTWVPLEHWPCSLARCDCVEALLCFGLGVVETIGRAPRRSRSTGGASGFPLVDDWLSDWRNERNERNQQVDVHTYIRTYVNTYIHFITLRYVTLKYNTIQLQLQLKLQLQWKLQCNTIQYNTLHYVHPSIHPSIHSIRCINYIHYIEYIT